MEAAYKNKDDIREMVKEIVGTYKPAKRGSGNTEEESRP